MRELEIKLTGRYSLGETAVHIDGEPVKFDKLDNGAVCKYQTEKDSVNIGVYRMLDVGGVLWFIMQLVFFVISIFGIFDVHRKERCIVIDFESEIDLRERDGKVILQLNIPKENEKAVDIQTDLPYREKSNVYYTDNDARKILKGLKWAKSITAAVIIAVVIAVLTVAL